MADDYIPRNVVIELLTQKQRDICPVGRCGRGYVYGRDRDEYDAIEADIDTVENIPAADVRLVVRSKWRHYEGQISCVNCESETEDDTPYCPYCGADMRERSNG